MFNFRYYLEMEFLMVQKFMKLQRKYSCLCSINLAPKLLFSPLTCVVAFLFPDPLFLLVTWLQRNRSSGLSRYRMSENSRHPFINLCCAFIF